jgi:hypothetical protein
MKEGISMKNIVKNVFAAGVLLTSFSVFANDRVCVNGEALRINNVQFLGHVSNIYSSFGKPIKTNKWYYTDGNYYVVDLVYPGVTFTVTDASSGYDRIQKVVITKPNIKLPAGVQVGMPEKLLHTLLHYNSQSRSPSAASIWAGCGCSCETSVYFDMSSDRKISKITIDYDFDDI